VRGSTWRVFDVGELKRMRISGGGSDSGSSTVKEWSESGGAGGAWC
jgi:hypothetical protein